MKEIKVLLLQGGVEVIAEVEPIRARMVASADGLGAITGYRLNKPFRLLPIPLPMQTPQGIQLNIQPTLIPLMGMTIQGFLEIKIEDIIGQPMDANKQFESQYVQRTTGLQLAS